MEVDGSLGWQRSFLLNCRGEKALWGHPAPRLSQVGDKLVAHYMERPWLQKTLLHPRLLTLGQKILGIQPYYRAVDPVAQVDFAYCPAPGKITVSGQLTWLGPPGEKVFLLNELSAAFFDKGYCQGKWVAPPCGWVRADELGADFALASSQFGVAMRGGELTLSAGTGEKHFGREMAGDLVWAGVIYQVDLPARDTASEAPLNFSYDLEVMDLRDTL